MLLVYTSASTGPPEDTTSSGCATAVGVAEGLGVAVIVGPLVAVGVGSGAEVGVGSILGVAVASGVIVGSVDGVGVLAVTVGDVTRAGAGLVATATSPVGVGSGWLSPQAGGIAAMNASSGSSAMLLMGVTPRLAHRWPEGL